jgi:RHS repeat-associated protein
MPSSAGTTYWALTDNENSQRDWITYGALVDHIVYDSFGKIYSQSSTAVPFNFMHNGVYYDSATGLEWHSQPSTGQTGRWYNPGIQRWMCEDPTGLGPDSNPYRYVGNSPTNGADPTGLAEAPKIPWEIYVNGDLQKQTDPYTTTIKGANGTWTLKLWYADVTLPNPLAVGPRQQFYGAHIKVEYKLNSEAANKLNKDKYYEFDVKRADCPVGWTTTDWKDDPSQDRNQSLHTDSPGHIGSKGHSPATSDRLPLISGSKNDIGMRFLVQSTAFDNGEKETPLGMLEVHILVRDNGKVEITWPGK